MNQGHEWLVCDQSRSALARLEPELKRAAFASDLQLRVLALYLLEQGGKRLRPALVFLGGRFGRWTENELLSAAAAMELIHVASLYHDDIMDRATLRRNVPSANARWGNSLAVLGGTYLVARAMARLCQLGRVANRLASEAAISLASGQLLEVENAYNLEITEEQHLEILQRKTGVLFELPLRLGACLACAAPEHCEKLASYGRQIGLAFQIIDDTLDLTASTQEMKKETGTDLREGVYSLAVLTALKSTPSVGSKLRSILNKMTLSDGDFAAVRELLSESDAVNRALEFARRCVDNALRDIQGLPGGPARDSLQHLAGFVLNRRS